MVHSDQATHNVSFTYCPIPNALLSIIHSFRSSSNGSSTLELVIPSRPVVGVDVITQQMIINQFQEMQCILLSISGTRGSLVGIPHHLRQTAVYQWVSAVVRGRRRFSSYIIVYECIYQDLYKNKG